MTSSATVRRTLGVNAHGDVEGSSPPRICAILPAYNESKYVVRAIQSLKKQTYPDDRFRLIVVDNESEDDTGSLAREAGATVVSCARGVRVGGIRNFGAKIAIDADVLAFLDADCEAPPEWLSRGVAELAEKSVGAVGGPCIIPDQATWVEWAFIGRAKSIADRDSARLAASNFMISAQTFATISGFNEDLAAGEDDDISARIRALGFKLRSLGGCAVQHHGYPKTLREFWRRETWHGSSQVAAAESSFDPMLVAVHLFVFCLFSLFAGGCTYLLGLIGSAGVVAAIIGLAICISMSLGYAELKIMRSDRNQLRLLPLTLLMITYFSARSFALLSYYMAAAKRAAYFA